MHRSLRGVIAIREWARVDRCDAISSRSPLISSTLSPSRDHSTMWVLAVVQSDLAYRYSAPHWTIRHEAHVTFILFTWFLVELRFAESLYSSAVGRWHHEHDDLVGIYQDPAGVVLTVNKATAGPTGAAGKTSLLLADAPPWHCITCPSGRCRSCGRSDVDRRVI
jgi:hypothetical protein